MVDIRALTVTATVIMCKAQVLYDYKILTFGHACTHSCRSYDLIVSMLSKQ